MSDTKHGWVTPRADGAHARCGGPGVCSTCDTEQEHERMLSGLFGRPMEAAAPASTVATEGEKDERPYCYVLESYGTWAGKDGVLLDTEYNRTDNFSGGRKGGIPLYRQPAPAAGDALASFDIEAAAQKMAECMDYPWAHMPEQGRAHMRENAQAVIDAAIAQQSQRKEA